MNKELNLSDEARVYLETRWREITSLFEQGQPEDPLGEEYALLKKLIHDCLTSKTKSYHYVLPTQLLCKVVDSSLDSRSLQRAYGKPGAFDARTVAHSVIVPFDQVLFEIYHLLSTVTVVYPIPNRISLHRTYRLIEDYLSEKSGGDRIEAVCTALFRTIGERFNIFDEVRREKVNAADVSSGMVADIECWLAGKIILLVEVKDRSLTLTQLDAKLDIARSQRISEILFIAEQGKQVNEEEAINQRIKTEFTSGQNIYVSNFVDFSLGILILLGEEGRVGFLEQIGNELDRANSSIFHRRAWASLLRQV